MWTTTSLTREETSKFQIHRRRTVEVWCSGVPVGSLAGFWDGRRLWEINSVVWNRKELKISIICDRAWFQLVHVLMFVVVPALYVSREQGGCLSSSLLLSMFLDLRQDSRRSSYVLSWMLFLVWMLESCFLSFDNIQPVPTYLIKSWAGFIVIGILILLGM